jgi:tyrosine-protein kinase Etk/Wzc
MSHAEKITTESQDEQTISLSDLVSAVVQYKKVILVSFLSFSILCAGYSVIKSPTYGADATLEYLSDGSSNLDSLLGGALSMGSAQMASAEMNTQIEIIKSRSILLDVIKQYHMDIGVEPIYFPILGRIYAHFYSKGEKLKPADSHLGLSSYSWGRDRVVVGEFDVPEVLEEEEFVLQSLGGNKYQLMSSSGDKILVGEAGKKAAGEFSGKSLSITVDEMNARDGVRFEVVKYPRYKYLEKLKKTLGVSQVGESSNLIKITLDGKSYSENEKILNTITQLAITKNAEVNAKQAEQTLVFLKEQRPTVAEDLKTTQAKLAAYQEKTGVVQIDAQGQAVIEKVANVTATISEVKTQIAKLSEQYTPKSFQIKQAKSVLASLYREQKDLEKEIKAMPSSDQEVVNLMRDVEVQQAIYKNLLNQIQTYEMLKAGTVSKLVLIDEAKPYPIRIDKTPVQTTLLGGLVGAFLGLGIAFVLYFSRNTIKEADEIEGLVGLPQFASLHESKIIEEQYEKFESGAISYKKLLGELDHYDVTLEALRSLMTALKLKLIGGKKVITISGPSPMLGKSFISANLAHVFASHGLKTLLIDSDIRRGKMREYFKDVKKVPGWVDLLAGSAKKSEVLKSTRFENLDFIPSGSRNKKNYLSIIQGSEVDKVLADFKESYDIIIIDTPPVLAASDAAILFQKSDVNLLVFGYDMHNRHEVADTMRQLSNTKVEVDGFMFNRIKSPTGGYYGYGYKYGYRYGYKYRYAEREDAEEHS